MIMIKEHQMEENPPRVSRKDGAQVASNDGPTRKSRYTVDESGDLIECSGKYCKSCTAALIADCVALCCCPCALVNLFTLAFVKVPLMVGRRCLGGGKKEKEKKKKKKKKKKVQEMKRKCKKSSSSSSNEGDDTEMERDGILKMGRAEWEILEIVNEEEEEEEEEEMGCVSARYEAEKVWIELYQVGHLGFGRVSFTGIN